MIAYTLPPLRRMLITFAIRGCWLVLLFLMTALPAVAQDNPFERLSTSERSDGNGYVLRFHLEEKADSFDVFQPSPDLIQFTLYSENIDTTAIKRSENPVYDEVYFYKIPQGIGIDLYLGEDQNFIADAYPDGGSEDLLLSLTSASRSDVEQLAEGSNPIIWSSLNINNEGMQLGTRTDLPNVNVFDDTYRRIKNNMAFDVVVIDPGHGGHDTGAIGHNGTLEKDITLEMAKQVGDYINEYLPDVKVVYTREDDRFVELEERGRIANKHRGDLFISIHCNNHNNYHAYGTEVYFLGLTRSEQALEVMKRENSVVRLEDNEESEELDEEELLIYEMANSGYMATSEKVAAMLDDQFSNRARRHSRGVKQAPFIVLFHASMPAVLIETGFISNPNEQRYLTSEEGKNIIASAIFRTIRDYKVDVEGDDQFSNSTQ